MAVRWNWKLQSCSYRVSAPLVIRFNADLRKLMILDAAILIGFSLPAMGCAPRFQLGDDAPLGRPAAAIELAPSAANLSFVP